MKPGGLLIGLKLGGKKPKEEAYEEEMPDSSESDESDDLTPEEIAEEKKDAVKALFEAMKSDDLEAGVEALDRFRASCALEDE